jgi:hypothetical protein
MKTTLIAALILVLLVCGCCCTCCPDANKMTSIASGGCTTDSDCPGLEECEYGQCVEPDYLY